MKRFIVEFPDDRTNPSRQRLQEILPLATISECSIAPDTVVAIAREKHCYGSDNEIEIDEPANMSEGDDGIWVAGWLFVPHPEY